MTRQPRRAIARHRPATSPRDDYEQRTMRGSASVACDGSALALVGGASGGDMEMEGRARAEEEDAPEAIDTDEDDAEFEERAHWGRRRAGAKKNGAKPTKKKEDKSQPKINLFCVVQASAEKKAASTEGHGETPAPPLAETQELPIEAVATAEGANVLRVQVQEIEEDGNGGSSVVEVVMQTVCTPSGVSAASPIDMVSPLKRTVTATTSTASSPEVVLLSPTMLSGRPKRQAVLRAEHAQLQQTSNDELFTTPPAGPSSKKNSSATNKATLDGEPERKATSNGSTGNGSLCGGLSNSGRKRKLEMAAGEKKPSTAPQTKAPSKARPSVFFLTEEQKKQVIEIEAVALFKEQLRAQRERDLVFFGSNTRDATENNPFFKARAFQKVIDVDAPEVIDVLDSPEPTKPRKSRWTKELPTFPLVQHIQCETTNEEDDTSASETTLLPQKKSRPEPEAVVVVDDNGDEDMESQGPSGAKRLIPDEADAQIPFDDAFWLLSATRSSNTEEDFLRSGDFSTDELIEKVAERYGVKEKRVRKTLEALESARTKRQEKALNLSLVDKYLPVQTAGMIGNNVPLKKLTAWLSAWKNGGINTDRDRNYDDSLFAFEGDDSEEDEDGTQLYRLFILKGDVGAGKSAAVYACAEELGYEIIEINAGQLRTGKAVVDIAGEATQSTRVLHGGGPVNDKQTKKKKKSKKRRTEGEAAKLSHLSLVLFEDVDLVFEEDKGFLSTLGSIAKHSKCPIVVTCRHLPDNFPTTPPAISERLTRPTTREFMAWISLVAYLEGIALSHGLASRLAELFECDIRRTLQFIQTYRHRLGLHENPHGASLEWKQRSPEPEVDAVVRADADAPIAITDSQEDEALESVGQRVPAWSRSTLRSFDLLSSNFLPLLGGSMCESVSTKAATESWTRDDKLRHVDCLDDLWSVLDGVSQADEWESVVAKVHRANAGNDEEGADFFHAEALTRLTLDVRMLSLSSFIGRRARRPDMLSLQACSLVDGVDRALQASRDDCDRTKKATRLATLKAKLDLPSIAKGSERVGARFCLDYVPLVARIVENSEPFQESRRRASRRNHYLGEVLLDMSAIDDLCTLQACFVATHVGEDDGDEIVPQSASSPLATLVDTTTSVASGDDAD